MARTPKRIAFLLFRGSGQEGLRTERQLILSKCPVHAGKGLTFLGEAVRYEVIAIKDIQEQEVYVRCYPALDIIQPAAEVRNAVSLMHFQPWPAQIRRAFPVSMQQDVHMSSHCCKKEAPILECPRSMHMHQCRG